MAIWDFTMSKYMIASRAYHYANNLPLALEPITTVSQIHLLKMSIQLQLCALVSGSVTLSTEVTFWIITLPLPTSFLII